ncbi:MAG: bifunctional adenosylcobinamide kinase/adenosylcobinamide-phosphate guanylyltransferase [Clostridia bacterium]
MYLVFGGAGSGKREFANSLQSDMKIVDHLEKIVWDNLDDAKNVVENIVNNNQNSIIICDEIGCGLVPIDKKEREFREILGEITVDLARKAEKVFYVTLGIARRIK